MVSAWRVGLAELGFGGAAEFGLRDHGEGRCSQLQLFFQHVVGTCFVFGRLFFQVDYDGSGELSFDEFETCRRDDSQ